MLRKSLVVTQTYKTMHYVDSKCVASLCTLDMCNGNRVQSNNLIYTNKSSG